MLGDTVPAPTVCDSVWFADGNIVLKAGTSLFKVYQGILCRESQLFKDIFSLPQPTAEETYEGCRMLTVHESAEDMELFLSTMFDHTFLDRFCGVREHATLLRLATKYQADQLRLRVMRCLNMVYPDTLEQLDRMNSTKPCPLAARYSKLFRSDYSSDIAVINAAKETNTLVLLPSAFLRGYNTSIREIVEAEAKHGLESYNKDSMLAALPDLCSLAHHLSFALIFSDQRDISDACLSPNVCHRTRREIMHELENPARVINPFFRIGFGNGNMSQSLCVACRSAFKASYQTGRKEAWEKLPGIFGLPAWDELRKLTESDDQDDGEVQEQPTPMSD